MGEAGRLDEQPVGADLAHQAREPQAQRDVRRAADAAAGDLADLEAAAVGEQRAVDADLAELVDQHGPALVGRAVGQGGADGGGLADAEGAADERGRNGGHASR
ncbi:MAG: hypothetical protein R2724_35065 [Bryobacterales bacterium]